MYITCPECGHTAEIDAGRIPAGGATANCPKCRCRFRVLPETTTTVSSEPLLILCPSCSHEQPFVADCTRCGVIFARYKPTQSHRAASQLPPTPPRSKKFLRKALVPLAVVLGLLLLWIFVKDQLPTTLTVVHATVAASSGLSHSVVARSDGTVWTWGSNEFGQLGNGHRSGGHGDPQKVSGLENVTGVAAGERHTLALKQDGTVWSWGDNLHCQLGDTSGLVGRTVPAPIEGLSAIIAIDAGDFFSVALKDDGTLWYFGDDFIGGRTNGGVFHEFGAPRQVEGIKDVTAFACGRKSIVALKRDGSVWCWGVNDQGQVGTGDFELHWGPVAVTGLDDVTAVAAGEQFTLALKKDGTVWGWGSLYLVSGNNLQRQTRPVQIADLVNIKEIKGGYWMAVALRGDGTVWHSGTDAKALPAEQRSAWDLLKRSDTASTSTIFAGGREAFLEKRDGTLYCWGLNDFGKPVIKGEKRSLSLTELVFDPATAPAPSATMANEPPPPPDQQFSSVAAGFEHSLALRRDGTAWSWGKKEFGQLGRRWGSFEAPGQVCLRGDEPIDDVAAVAAGADHSLAVKTDGSLWIWGKNFQYILYELRVKPEYRGFGRGKPVEHMLPTRVAGVDDAVAVAGGHGGRPEFIVLHRSGRVSEFGINASLEDPFLARPVEQLDGVVAIAAGTLHFAALKGDGTVWSWGNNADGQLGDGTTTSRRHPQPVPELNNVIRIAAGSGATLAVKGDGTVWGWGKDIYTSLPGGTPVVSSTRPLPYPYLEGITAVALPGRGYSNGPHYLALDRNGQVWSWGGNFLGQLGRERITASIIVKPQMVRDIDNVVALSAGGLYTLALRKDGSIMTWGHNAHGAMGSANRADSAYPVRVGPVSLSPLNKREG